MIAVRTSPFLEARTLASSDVCVEGLGRVDTRRACTALAVRAAGTYYVWVYAAQPFMHGAADLRVQRVTGRFFPSAATCAGPAGESASCWVTTHPGFSFGGFRQRVPGRETDDLLHLETTLLPGSAPGTGALPEALRYGHVITTTRGTSIVPNHRSGGRLHGAPLSHRHGFGAEWIGVGRLFGFRDSDLGTRRAGILFGSIYGGGPIRLLRNDHVPSLDPHDFDRDGLGEELEEVMVTCDSPSSPSPVSVADDGSPLDCARGACASDPASAACARSPTPRRPTGREPI